MLEVKLLGYRHSPKTAPLFENLSFSLARGQTLVMLGRNGRGKTTLLKCLVGLLAPSTGTIALGGAIGYVPQHFASPFAYSVFEVVLMGRARHIGLFGSPNAEDHAQARAALDLVGISDFSERAIGSLSGGERQLVLIADVLLLDEPTSALDYHNQAIVLSVLKRLSDQRGLSIVMTTHDPSHALEIADRVVLLHGNGRSEEGTTDAMCTERRLSALYAIAMKRLDYQTGNLATSSIVAGFGTRQHPS